MTEELFWAMTAASVYGITHHPKNHMEGGKVMTAEEAGKLADELLIEYRKRLQAGYFNG